MGNKSLTDYVFYIVLNFSVLDEFDQHFQASVRFPLTRTVGKSQQHQNKFSGKWRTKTWGRCVRSKSATSVLWSPQPIFFWLNYLVLGQLQSMNTTFKTRNEIMEYLRYFDSRRLRLTTISHKLVLFYIRSVPVKKFPLKTSIYAAVTWRLWLLDGSVVLQGQPKTTYLSLLSP